MARTNLTLHLDEETIREIKVLAAERGTSVSALMAHYVHRLTAERARYHEAMRAAFESMEEAASSGRVGRSWTREELYDR